MGLFLALWGKKECFLLFKIYGVCAGCRRRAWWSSKLLLVGRGPALGPVAPQSPWLTTHTATLGSYCFLARPERNGILIETNSSRQNKGEEPASCSHLGACFLHPGSVEWGWVVMRGILGTSLGRRASSAVREWVEALGGPVGEVQGHPWATMLPPSLSNPESHGSAETQGRLMDVGFCPPGFSLAGKQDRVLCNAIRKSTRLQVHLGGLPRRRQCFRRDGYHVRCELNHKEG